MKKLLAFIMVLCLLCAMTVPVFASGASSGAGTADYETSVKPLFDEILKQLNVSSIVTFLASVIGAGIAFVFMWWAIRKGIKILMSAIRKGRVSS